MPASAPLAHPARALISSVVLAAVAAVVLMCLDTSDADAGSPGWLVSCPYVKSLGDDPVVRPGRPGGSHLHDFLGNVSTAAGSTYASMRGARTSCALAADTAAYWVPALYRDGRQVRPTSAGTRQQVYYRDNNLRPGTAVEPLPADLRIVAGKASARSEEENPQLGREIYWGCSDNSTGKMKQPPPACGTGIVTLHVGFPNCWDGTLTHRDDSAHLTYPRRGACPPAFPRALPRVVLRMEYPVGKASGRITLSSGAPHTVHADLWNTWRQDRLDALVSRCLNQDHSCGKPTS